MMVTVTTLGLPALLLAGLAASPHCAAMCGLWQARLAAHQDSAFHLGRVLAYGVLGALAGSAGAVLLWLSGGLMVAEGLRLAALLVLMTLALWPLRHRRRSPCHARTDGRRGLLAGLALGLVPCPLLYAAAAYAALSADPRQGALLMVAFALGSLPLLQAGTWGWRRLLPTAGVTGGVWPRATATLLLVLLGTGGGGWVWACLR